MKISEVSSRCDVTAYTLRYYEQIGLLSPVNRNRGGIREYSEQDVQRVEFIKHMRNAGLSIELLLEYIGLVAEGDVTTERRRAILVERRESLRSNIEELQNVLALLDRKIAGYDERLLKIEQGLSKENLK